MGIGVTDVDISAFSECNLVSLSLLQKNAMQFIQLHK